MKKMFAFSCFQSLDFVLVFHFEVVLTIERKEKEWKIFNDDIISEEVLSVDSELIVNW